MGGEMAYILQQRLQAQNVGEDKSTKVLGDIMSTIFNKQFLDVLFRPQDLYSRSALRQFFERIAHSSIMRLNEASMDKLFDLMTMAVKYQFQVCRGPVDILIITMNHLDGLRSMFESNQALVEGIDYAHLLLTNHYFEAPLWELSLIRNTLMTFLQDARVKVSLMLREKRQLEDGRFRLFRDQVDLPYGATVPGTVRYFDNGEVSRVSTFPAKEKFVTASSPGNLQCRAKDRGTKLGENMYQAADSTQVRGGGGLGRSGAPPAGDELALLSKLIVRQEEAENPAFDLSLFDSGVEEKRFKEETFKPNVENVKVIDVSQDKKTLTRAIKDVC
ncbi:protein OSCP1-like protein [Aphelenchoides avenae]|nr:protein OSCP1-like protein [Aphelenchus avenae]